MHVWPTWSLLALAVSLDGFGVGVTYGLRKIRVPWLSVAIIALCSGSMIALSMLVGRRLSGWIEPAWASAIGALILIAIGVWALVQLLRRGEREQQDRARDGDGGENRIDAASGQAAQTIDKRATDEEAAPEVQYILRWEWKSIGLVISILRTPSLADIDRSGTITAGEALWLGLALSLDGLGAGIGAALLGLPLLQTSVSIALVSGLCMALGLHVGYWLSHVKWIRKLALLPACLLIILGISKLF